jgi:phosphoglycerate dehydrogenase-like enzyme
MLLVNCGRAEVIEENCLIEALNKGIFSAAGLDVHYYEPLPCTHALCTMNNVILTPHMAESGGRAPHLLRQEAMDKIIGFVRSSSEPPQDCA